MSVQVKRRREAATFLAGYVGAQGELLVDTTNNRVQVHDGATPGGWAAAKLADVAQRTTVADASYTALPSDRTIAYTALTAARVVTLPAASAYPTGTQLLVVDEAGACSATNTITLSRVGADTINGASTAILAFAFGYMALESNGAGKWTQVDFGGTGVALTSQLTNRNAVINGNLAINQRGYVSGTSLAAGAYAHDRWKAGSSGGTYTFAQAVPDTTATISAGTLVQMVEGANVASTSFWLSWTGTAQARVWQGSAAGAYAASPILVTNLTIGFNTALEFGTGTLGLVQFEVALPSAGPTRFERRPVSLELLLCQRYFEVSYAQGVAPGAKSFYGPITYGLYGAPSSNYSPFVFVPFKAIKRTTPTITLYSPNTGTAGKAYDQTANADVAAASYNSGDAAFQFNATVAAATGNVFLVAHYIASAEL